MTPHIGSTREELLEHVFSDDPAPDIQAAIVVSHVGDECLGASWLLSRLHDRASVFRLTSRGHVAGTDAITLTGLPANRCHNLGWVTGSLANDLETLTWLVSAAVKTLQPRLLVSHATEGVNLDHDAVAFAVQMTALLLPRFGNVAPVVLEFQCHHDGLKAVHHDAAAPTWEQGVRVDFGPESRRLKEQILVSQLESMHAVHHSALMTEVYRPRQVSQQIPHDIIRGDQTYQDAPWCTVGEFRAQTAAVARRFAQTGLIAAITKL